MFKSLVCIFLLLHGIATIAQHRCGHAHMHKVGGGMVTDPSNMRSDTLDIYLYDITLDMTGMNNQSLSGACRVEFGSLMDNQSHINLDLEGLQVDSVKRNGQTLPFNHSGSTLYVVLNTILNTGDMAEVTVFYHGSPIQDTSWGGFYYASGYAYNLGVGFDAEPHNYGRVWHPCFDNFVEKSNYHFHVLTNNGRTAYCNGLRTGVEIIGQDSLLTHWVMDYPIPSYLASVAVSNYVHAESTFENSQGEAIPIYLTAKAVDTTDMKISMQNLVPWLTYAQEKFGDYKWPRAGYCAVPFNAGAMEHATSISYPLYAIDGSLDYETLMAHEMAHHWWGNLVTCETAGDMWINEGMASFCEALFMEALYGEQAYQDYVRSNFKDVLTQAHRRDGGYYAVAGVPSSITYGDHVYNKGALIGHNLRGHLGDELLWQLMQALMNDYAYSHISTSSLGEYWQSLTAEDVIGFFDNWITQPGLPEYRVISANTIGNDQWQVQVEQFSHHTTNALDNVKMQIVAVDENGIKHHDVIVLNTDVTSYTMTLPANFQPIHFYLNDDERLQFAVLAEEKWVNTTGANDADFAEMGMDVNNLGANDSLWIRVENHWAAADPMQSTTGYRLSTDRWWSVMLAQNEGSDIEADIRYYGASNQTNYYDPTFFEELFASGRNEDSLVLMYRSNSMTAWQEHPNYSLHTAPGLTNGTGRIHINALNSGQYCWAYRDPSNSIASIPSLDPVFMREAQSVRIQPGHKKLHVIAVAANGQRVYDQIVDGETHVDLTPFASGHYTFIALNETLPPYPLIWTR
jgi:hypothetical protein